MATWTKTNNIITLTQDTTMSELVNDSDIPLVDADIIQLKGHNLIVDIITCGSADPDYNDEVNIGVTVKNDGGGECNLEFKDLSGIRLNATLPGTVHPWVDPENPLPVITKDPRKVIHGDPYCTKLTANARAEIQLAGNFSLGGGDMFLPTETRTGNFWSNSKTYPTGTNNIIEFNTIFPLHIGDYIVPLHSWQAAGWHKITNFENNTATLDRNLDYKVLGGLYGLVAGGVLIHILSTSYNKDIITSNLTAGTVICIGERKGETANAFATNAIIKADRICTNYNHTGRIAYAGLVRQNCNVFIKQCVTSWIFLQDFESTNCNVMIDDLAVYLFAKTSGGSHPTCKAIINGGFITGNCVPAIRAIGTQYKLFNTNAFSTSVGSENSPFANIYCKDCIFTSGGSPQTKYVEQAGTIEKSNLSWHHKPKTASDTTWKYSDHLVSPKSILRLKVRRMVESASSASVARVAITDTANWYPQTKYGALSELVMNNLETDQWHTFSMQYRNPTDEPQQVRVWECASGATDAGYLSVETASGGPM